MKYKVIQQHFGDKQYFVGDERIVENEQDAKMLIGMGLIATIEKPKTSKSSTNEPKTSEPSTNEQEIDESLIEEQKVSEPLADEQEAGEPLTNEPPKTKTKKTKEETT